MTQHGRQWMFDLINFSYFSIETLWYSLEVPQLWFSKNELYYTRVYNLVLYETCLFVFVLRFYSPVNPWGSCWAWAIYLTTLFSWQAQSTVLVHLILPETDNGLSWISRRERMTVENTSRSISMKECCRTQLGSNPQPPEHINIRLSHHGRQWMTQHGR